MGLPEKIHQLEQDIIQFKASQDIGSSSSRIQKVATLDYTGSSTGAKYFVGVFKSKNVVHPLIMPRMTIKANGQVVSGCGFNNDTVSMLAQLYDKGTVNDNIFDEYTTGFYLAVLNQSGTITLEGTLYSTCEGTFTLYAYDP